MKKVGFVVIEEGAVTHYLYVNNDTIADVSIKDFVSRLCAKNSRQGCNITVVKATTVVAHVMVSG